MFVDGYKKVKRLIWFVGKNIFFYKPCLCVLHTSETITRSLLSRTVCSFVWTTTPTMAALFLKAANRSSRLSRTVRFWRCSSGVIVEFWQASTSTLLPITFGLILWATSLRFGAISITGSERLIVSFSTRGKYSYFSTTKRLALTWKTIPSMTRKTAVHTGISNFLWIMWMIWRSNSYSRTLSLFWTDLFTTYSSFWVRRFQCRCHIASRSDK